MQSNSTEVKRDCHVMHECYLYSVQAAVVQMVVLLSLFLSNNDADRCNAIERQFWEQENIIQDIIQHKFCDNDGQDDICFTDLLKKLSDIEIEIDGRKIVLNEIFVNITDGKLSLEPGDDKISIMDITSPCLDDGRVNPTLLIFAWSNFYKRASCKYDSYSQALFQFATDSTNGCQDPTKLFSYLATRFWNRDALTALNNLGSSTAKFFLFGLDKSNRQKIGERKPIIGWEFAAYAAEDSDGIIPTFSREDMCETSMRALQNIEINALESFGIGHEDEINHGVIIHEAINDEEDDNSIFLQIFLTCLILFVSLVTATYLLFGNLLFNYILPFYEIANYIFTGIIAATFVLFPIVISIIRTYNIISSDARSYLNPNYLARVFKPLVECNRPEAITLYKRQIEIIQ
jgi:hypothetical protein